MSESDPSRPAGTGRRERQRRTTRSRILLVAMQLFRERGYHAVTVDEIVAEVGVSPRTFYRYFAAKEELVISFHSGAFDEVIDAVRRNEQSLGFREVVRRAWLDSIETQDFALMATRFRIMSGSPSLQLKLRERRQLWADQLATALLDGGHLHDAFVAEYFSRCVLLASECAIEHHDEDDPAQQYAQLFDAAMSSLLVSVADDVKVADE